MSDAEELLAKLGNSASPEIRQLRDKVESSVADMKGVIADQAEGSADKLRDVTKSVIEYVQENPAVAAGTAIAVALIYVGFSRREERE